MSLVNLLRVYVYVCVCVFYLLLSCYIFPFFRVFKNCWADFAKSAKFFCFSNQKFFGFEKNNNVKYFIFKVVKCGIIKGDRAFGMECSMILLLFPFQTSSYLVCWIFPHGGCVILFFILVAVVWSSGRHQFKSGKHFVPGGNWDTWSFWLVPSSRVSPLPFLPMQNYGWPGHIHLAPDHVQRSFWDTS